MALNSYSNIFLNITIAIFEKLIVKKFNMENLSILLQNCYGIWKLKKNLKFTNKKTQLIYAQNWTMKSSFAKTFEQLSNWNEPEELIYWRASNYEIKSDWTILIKEELEEKIYVAHSEANYKESEKISTLLVDATNKKKYEKEIWKIKTEQNKLIAFLKWKTGIKGDEKLISQFVSDFNKDNKEFLDLLDWITIKDLWFTDIDYSIISKNKVDGFLKMKDISTLLQEYIDTYEDILSKSKYFSKGIFNHNNWENIYKSLWDNNFFEAEHKVKLKWETEEIDSYHKLETKIENDKKTILWNPELEKKFKLIDDKLKWNAELREFRNYIENNKYIIKELADYNSFKKNIWISYLFESWDLLKDLLKIYTSSKIIISNIIKEAKQQETEWHSIVDNFNERFNPNFTLKIENQDDIILKWETAPQVIFEYDEWYWEEPIKVSNDTLKKVLSTWERRTLFILNLLFELSARKKDWKEHIIILDDIADSFDYSNKYSIIEYLKELSEEGNNLYFILLTHNFDFFRTVQYRFFWDKYRKQSYMVNKLNKWEIDLLEIKYIKPFEYFKNHFYKKKDIFLATIPFVRNLIEYSDWMNSNYLDLTCCLHKKWRTDTLTVNCIFNILNSKLWWSRSLDPSLPATDNIFDFIESTARYIYSTWVTWINLENKIIYSIINRLYWEKIMIDEIKPIDPDIENKLESETNQTRFLFDQYSTHKLLIWDKGESIKKVVMLTPENIHINSFMYEPILDTSEDELRLLYNNLKRYV